MVPYLTSPLLDAVKGVRHGFFTRQGGVSRGIYASLNLGAGSHDDPAVIDENRSRAARALGIEADHLNIAWQVHSAQVLRADAPFGLARPEGDGVITARPGLACAALAADCAPVLLADPKARVIGAVHAGWRGALGGVIGAAVAAMRALGARAEDVVAVVGPCIGPQSYEVGPEFFDQFLGEDRKFAAFFSAPDTQEHRYFDLPAFALGRLRAAGVAQCDWTGHDTFSDEVRFFSNRRAFKRGESDYGRLLSAIVLVG